MKELVNLELVKSLSRFKGMKYALIDYPNYLNPGDSAIWLGTRKILEQVLGTPPEYACTLKNFNSQCCKSQISEGPLFFLGGGNFGDLYQKHNEKRISIMNAMLENPVVLLPLSVADSKAQNKTVQSSIRDALSRHADLTVFTRERMSQDILLERYQTKSILCPDLAHCVPPANRFPKQDTLRLMRDDAEKNYLDESSSPSLDWRDLPRMTLVNRFGKLADLLPSCIRRMHLYDMLAKKKVALAMKALGSAQHVETDRLHAVILSVNMGLPVTAHDNSTQKISSYVACWQDKMKNVHLEMQ